MENWGLLLFDEARFLVNEVRKPPASACWLQVQPSLTDLTSRHAKRCSCAHAHRRPETLPPRSQALLSSVNTTTWCCSIVCML